MEAISTPELANLISECNLLIGMRQVVKALNREPTIIRCVVVASDAEQQIKDTISLLSTKVSKQTFEFASMKELGAICKIKVNCAVLGLTEKLS